MQVRQTTADSQGRSTRMLDVQAALMLCFGTMLLYQPGLPLPWLPRWALAPHRTATDGDFHGQGSPIIECTVRTDYRLLDFCGCFPRRLADGSQAPPMMDGASHPSHQKSSPLRTRASQPRPDQHTLKSSWECRQVPRGPFTWDTVPLHGQSSGESSSLLLSFSSRRLSHGTSRGQGSPKNKPLSPVCVIRTKTNWAR